MEFRATEKAVPVCETVVNAVSELPVDGDFILPEYCPDVATVLKCHMTVTVQSRQLSGDRYMVDGTVLLGVLYLDEERRCVRTCEFSQPFSTVFSLPSPSPQSFFTLQVHNDYVNCRAIGPRRLDIHGAFSVQLTVKAAVEKAWITAVQGDGVHTRRVLLTHTVPAAFQEKSFTLNEVMELSNGHHAAEAILYTAVTPLVSECKVLLNKAIVKGTVQVYVLYLIDPQNGATEMVEAEIPFSQIVDMEGLSEEWVCDATATLTASDVRIDASQSGEAVRLAVTAKVLCELYGWRLEQVEAVCDAYSSHCPLITETQSVQVKKLHGVLRDEQTVRHTCELPSEDIQEILGLWCTPLSAAMTKEGEKVTLEGRLMWCMLVQDSRGEVSYFERTEPFSLPYTDGGWDAAPTVQVRRTEHQTVGGGKMELHTCLFVTRRCETTEDHTVLSCVSADESAAYPIDKAALKIVYAERGESLWEIARRSRTAVETIMEENHLTGDTLAADTMLLIPLR